MFYRCLILIAGLAYFCDTSVIQAKPLNNSQEVWVISSAYSSYEALKTILVNSNLIDDSFNWTGASATLVSMGDVANRVDANQILDLFIRLQTQAAKAGGRFLFMLGEEEINALTGNISDLHPDSLAYFASLESKAIREEYFSRYFPLLKNSKESQSLEDKLEKQIPKGLFVRLEMFSPNGKYGRWLRKQSVIERIGENVFTHGSIPKLEHSVDFDDFKNHMEKNLAKVISNSSLEKSVQRLYLLSKENNSEHVNYQNDVIDFLNDENPISYLGGTLCHSFYYQEILQKRLQKLNASRVIVGHEEKYDVSLRHNGLLVSLGRKPEASMLDSSFNSLSRDSANLIKIEGKKFEPFNAKKSVVPLENYMNLAITYPEKHIC